MNCGWKCLLLLILVVRAFSARKSYVLSFNGTLRCQESPLSIQFYVEDSGHSHSYPPCFYGSVLECWLALFPSCSAVPGVFSCASERADLYLCVGHWRSVILLLHSSFMCFCWLLPLSSVHVCYKGGLLVQVSSVPVKARTWAVGCCSWVISAITKFMRRSKVLICPPQSNLGTLP